MTQDAIAPADWRSAMGYFASGVTLVSTWVGSGENTRAIASTVSSFCSVSLDPPLLLVCLGDENPILEPLLACERFGVNILGSEGGAAAMHFAKPGQNDDFSTYPYQQTANGAPQLAMAPCFIDCALDAAYRAGDHQIIIGRGLSISAPSGDDPLIYHQGGFIDQRA